MPIDVVAEAPYVPPPLSLIRKSGSGFRIEIMLETDNTQIDNKR